MQKEIKNKNLRIATLLTALVISILWTNSLPEKMENLQGKIKLNPINQVKVETPSYAILNMEIEAENSSIETALPSKEVKLLNIKLSTENTSVTIKKIKINIHKDIDKPEDKIYGLIYLTDEKNNPVSTTKEALNNRESITLTLQEPLTINANSIVYLNLKGDIYLQTNLELKIEDITTTNGLTKTNGIDKKVYVTIVKY